jgi:protein CpxP
MKHGILPAALTFLMAGTLAAGSLAVAQTAAAPDANQPPAATAPAHTPDPQRQTARIAKQLNLTADQTAKLEPILADRDQKIAALRANTSLAPRDAKKQMHAIVENTRTQLAAVLTADQLQQLKSMQHAHGHRGQAQPTQTAPTA